jgi:anthraniloyl-CoA monooxygenase
MKIDVIGGGPAGLYFALLMKKADPSRRIAVYERNRPDDTFGFGVVFSAETLGHFRDYDAPSYDAIRANFAYWDDIDTHYRGTVVRSTGHGFCGMARKTLLLLLHERCRALGIDLHFETEKSVDDFPDADLILAADGINSATRERFKATFRPSVDLRPNKFVWLGSTKPLPAFTFIFKENDAGIWNVHAYQYNKEHSTWIFETTGEAWARTGLAVDDEAATVAYLERLFADELGGHRLITNRSLWRNFPTITCESWVHDNIVIMGDAAHTAHFSIGSGTKLAMEDAIALYECFEKKRTVAAALAEYDATRHDEVERIQHAAEVSLAWFEHVRRYWGMEPPQFAFSLLSRSHQITYENLGLRDPAFIEGVDRWFAGHVRKTQGFAVPTDPAPPPLFTPFRLRDMVVANRVVVSPMCQYSATDGLPDDWHLVHLGSRAMGGAGLVFTEMTDVSAAARITPGCAGMYNDAHEAAWKRIVDFIHVNTAAKFCLQLGHAGRKGSTKLMWQGIDEPLPSGNWPIVSASPLPYFAESQVPKALDRIEMDSIVADYVQAAERAARAGFDMLEIHAAHGYLLASFISPLTNKRTDAYGGSLDNRLRFPLEVFDAVRVVWPAHKPMSVRISATDWMDGGITGDDAVAIARAFHAHGVDLIDVSTGQTVPESTPRYGRMYQTPFAEQIRNEAGGLATIAVGNITTWDQVNTIVASGRADLVALARPHLWNPYFTRHAAAAYGYEAQPWPDQYLPGKDQAFRTFARQREEEAERRRALKPSVGIRLAAE